MKKLVDPGELMLAAAAAPVYAVRGLVRAARRVKFWRVSYMTEITCRTCGSPISLVGMWRCNCGFTYKGHLLRVCPICSSLPRMARCFSCGATEKLPEP